LHRISITRRKEKNMQLKFLILILMIGLWTFSSTCHAQQLAANPKNESGGRSVDHSPDTAGQHPEGRIIQKALNVTPLWQTVTFEKPLRINQKGLMGLHLAVDNELYISTMVDHPLNPECTKAECAAEAFCLRRLSDGVLIRPEVTLIADNGVEVKLRPAGHLYPFFDRHVITVAMRAFNHTNAFPPPLPKTFKAMRIRSTEPFEVRYLYWNTKPERHRVRHGNK
jgi:hypothetical protein